MNEYECITTVLATGTLLTGIGTIALAIITNKNNKKIAERQRQTDINIAKRQGVIDLHNAWAVVNDINTANYIVPDVIKAINALSLTASLWIHDVIERDLLYQSYWQAYKDLYDKLIGMNDVLRGLNYTPKSKITADIKKAYLEMNQKELSHINSTTI
ncbi:hypothetical protein AAW12_08665 [Sphingobacterium sp. Ag1]|uniref:hypothetical protein n=1 Tax=Sphingobacterium sp. Ag1 TaxID=1643451 RepID=UPI0006275DCF|nr:hypothetical protein [Sphingobacterium sp. Ag1]KKO91724.1 hypothetical protein AAW12_08665 [Sphingobacterium sp. Ag1]